MVLSWSPVAVWCLDHWVVAALCFLSCLLCLSEDAEAAVRRRSRGRVSHLTQKFHELCNWTTHIKLGRKSLIFTPSCLSFRHIWRTVKTNTMFAVTWLWWQVLIQMEKRRAELKRLRRFSYLSSCCTGSFSYRGVKSSEDKNNNL